MGETPPLPLPEHPELRELAQALEAAGVAAEILEYKWRVVYTTSEDALGLGLDSAEMHHHYGLSLVIRPEHRPDWVTDRQTGSRWWRAAGPHMVRDVPPDDPDFDAVFGRQAPAEPYGAEPGYRRRIADPTASDVVCTDLFRGVYGGSLRGSIEAAQAPRGDVRHSSERR